MIESRKGIRIAINIDVLPGEAGGTAQSTQGLVNSLGQLDGPEQFVLCAQTPEQAEWIAKHRGPNEKIVVRSLRLTRRETVTFRWSCPERSLATAQGNPSTVRPFARRVRWMTGRLIPQQPTVPLSDGYFESLDCDVLHFPTQPFAVCALPTIYNPHDLQHLHYPQFWSSEELLRRETVYRAACNISSTVVVGSEWIKQDVIRQYRVHPDKVQIIPWAPPTTHYPQISREQIDSDLFPRRRGGRAETRAARSTRRGLKVCRLPVRITPHCPIRSVMRD